MKFRRVVLSAIFVFASFGAAAEVIPAGLWRQTSSTAGDCSTCQLTVVQITPHILKLSTDGSFVGYAYNTQKNGIYTGVCEWEANKGGDFDNVVFQVEMTYKGKVLSLNAKSIPLNFSATYQKK